MKVLTFSRYALSSCVADVSLAGCGGSQPPIGALGTLPQTRTIGTHATHGGQVKSWILPRLLGSDLLSVPGA